MIITDREMKGKEKWEAEHKWQLSIQHSTKTSVSKKEKRNDILENYIRSFYYNIAITISYDILRDSLIWKKKKKTLPTDRTRDSNKIYGKGGKRHIFISLSKKALIFRIFYSEFLRFARCSRVWGNECQSIDICEVDGK